MTEASAPLSRLTDAARAAVQALLLTELTTAWTRARAAGCPPALLTEVFEARRSPMSADGEWCEPGVAGECGG
ncbi:hypothetical protein ACIA5G_25825 [Amycolatopsis sp. NPDC051758]|uniref:hypothetical protein n=1 Tax=Amycolatopsis sp. NPDC051758 TaxID=3363935 RepID=UPI003796629B